jgi:hypothetical protein
LAFNPRREGGIINAYDTLHLSPSGTREPVLSSLRFTFVLMNFCRFITTPKSRCCLCNKNLAA